MPKVTVIVPVYGVEKYIERCARSLFEQTLDDIEFIFVDDCTKDKSIDILKNVIEEYPNLKDNIRILHHASNRGLSFARETGIKAATGDFIGHCDSDDWVSRDMYKKLYQKAVTDECDFVKCGHYYASDETHYSIAETSIKEGISPENALSLLLRNTTGVNSIWNTLTKRDIFIKHNISFTPYAMLEDMFVVTQIISNCTKIGVLQEPLYYYFKNYDSISRIYDKEIVIKRCRQGEENIKWIRNYVENKFGNKYQLEEVILNSIPRYLLVSIMQERGNGKIWREIGHSKYIDYIFSPYCTIRQKMQYSIICMNLYPIYKKVFK